MQGCVHTQEHHTEIDKDSQRGRAQNSKWKKNIVVLSSSNAEATL